MARRRPRSISAVSSTMSPSSAATEEYTQTVLARTKRLRSFLRAASSARSGAEDVQLDRAGRVGDDVVHVGDAARWKSASRPAAASFSAVAVQDVASRCSTSGRGAARAGRSRHGLVACVDQLVDDVRADEPAASCNCNPHRLPPPPLSRLARPAPLPANRRRSARLPCVIIAETGRQMWRAQSSSALRQRARPRTARTPAAGGTASRRPRRSARRRTRSRSIFFSAARSMPSMASRCTCSSC